MAATRLKPAPGADIAARANAATGEPHFDRRLSDKVLSAFNHAYASGAQKVAERLKAVLRDVERNETKQHERRGVTAVTRAELWEAFVEARNAYNALAARPKSSIKARQASLEQMIEAYCAWAEA